MGTKLKINVLWWKSLLFGVFIPGDFLGALADEGIYGWILSLIEEGKCARFVDRLQGIYELDWQSVVSKYWYEWRGSRSVKNVTFSHRRASNTLRAALLNAYKDKGAIEFPEKKVLDSGNKTIKRCFRLPSTVMHKLSRYQVCCWYKPPLYRNRKGHWDTWGRGSWSRFHIQASTHVPYKGVQCRADEKEHSCGVVLVVFPSIHSIIKDLTCVDLWIIQKNPDSPTKFQGLKNLNLGP